MYNADYDSRMKKIILFLLFTIPIYGQNSDLISDEELCKQIKSAIKYLKADKKLNTRNFKFGSTIENGSLYEFYFAAEYVAYQLGIEKDKIFEFDKNKTYPVFKKLKETKHQTTELNLDCIKKRKKPNVEISKLDRESLILNITTKRVGKSGASGKVYLFFFENGKVIKVHKSYWIE